MVDPTNVFAMDDIQCMTGFNIEPVVASESSILARIKKQYGATKERGDGHRDAVDVDDGRKAR